METDIIIALLALFFSAIFSGYEIAYFSSNKLKIELDKKQGKRYALIIDKFLVTPDKLISTLLMGNNVAIVIYGICIAKILDPLIENYITTSLFGILAIETLIATIIVLITAEFLPKALSRLNPNGFLKSLYLVIIFFYYLLYPLTYITNKLSNHIITKWLGVNSKSKSNKSEFDKTDLMHLSNEVIGADNDDDNEHSHEIEIFQNALNFSSVKLFECMIPRTEIAALEDTESVEELTKLFVESGYSRIMIYKDNIDNIIGYVHSKDLFKKGSLTMNQLLRKVIYVNETMSAQSLLAFFTKSRKSIAVVRDEYGGTSGIVTLEDLIEEIFGDISDELDKEEFIEKKISDNEFIFSARLEVEEVNRKFNLDLPESDGYETLAGLIMYYHQNIPAENEVIVIEEYIFTIIKTTKNKIETINLKFKME